MIQVLDLYLCLAYLLLLPYLVGADMALVNYYCSHWGFGLNWCSLIFMWNHRLKAFFQSKWLKRRASFKKTNVTFFICLILEFQFQ